MSQTPAPQMSFSTNVVLKPFRWMQSKSALLLSTREASDILIPGQFCLMDFENVQLLANFMGLDVVDLTNYRLDHVHLVRIRVFVSDKMKVDKEALSKTERSQDFTKLCADIPNDMPILHVFLDPELWREKPTIKPNLIQK